jgi:hypothetical protein
MNKGDKSMVIKNKKIVFINGTVLMPLIIKKRAIIYHNGKKTITPAVVAVKKISKNSIIFETHNYIYHIIPQAISEAMIIDARLPVCA